MLQGPASHKIIPFWGGVPLVNCLVYQTEKTEFESVRNEEQMLASAIETTSRKGTITPYLQYSSMSKK